MRPVIRVCIAAPRGGAVDHHPDQRQPDAAEGAEDRVGERHVDAGGDEAPSRRCGRGRRRTWSPRCGPRSPSRRSPGRPGRRPSGRPGSRLKTSSSRLIEASQANIASTAEAPEPRFDSRRLAELVPAADDDPGDRAARRRSPGSPPARRGRPALRPPALSASRSIRAMPPKIQSWIELIPIPLRRATTAWPSSCRRIEPKKPAALSTASRNAWLELPDGPSRSS